MKIIILVFIFCSSVSYAASIEECDQQTSEAQKMAIDLSLPNCYRYDFLQSAKNKDLQPLCEDCKSKFEKRYPGKINTPNPAQLQKSYLEANLKEYKKNMVNNLIQAAKVSALPQTGATFKKSTAACAMKSKKEMISSCKSPAAKKLLEETNLISDLSSQIAGELAQILNTDPNYHSKNKLMNRNKEACFVPEKDILYVVNSTIEESFTPDLIDAIKNLDPAKFKTMDDIFLSDAFTENYSGDIADLKSSMELHPYLFQKSRSTSAFINFFKKVNSPASLNNLKSAIYNEQNGNDFDSELAQSCTSSYNSLIASICNDDFEKGNLDLDAFENYHKIRSDNLGFEDQAFANTDQLIEKNVAFLSLCNLKSDKTKLNLSTKIKEISASIAPNYRDQDLGTFLDTKYIYEFGSMNSKLCSMTDSNCIEGTLSCSAYKKYKNLKNKETLDSKLANSSNKEGNALLRSMIGDPKNLDPKTKEILVLQGILPKDDGTLVAQAEIPERQPGYFNQAPAASAQAKVTAPVQPASSGRAASTTRSQQSASSDTSSWTGQPTTSTMPDLSDYYKNQKEMSDIESEIMRRLSSMPEQKPASKAAAKKIARDAYAKTGRSMPAALEDYYANRMMGQNAPSTTGSADFDNAADTGSGPRREASVSGTDSAAEKWKKDGMNRALAGMHGAQQGAANAGRDPASANPDDANAKALTTVALNVAEDPKVSLSQSLSEKINKNDPETQLLQVLVKNKSNFILQMKSVNFKVVFDDQKKLRLLVDSGDPKEAERLRPQLEIFFKRLSAL